MQKLTILLALIIFTSGCLGSNPASSKDSINSAAGGLLTLALNTGNATSFFSEGMEVRFSVTQTYTQAPRRVVAGIKLPDNVELVSGSLSFAGNLTRSESEEIVAVIRAKSPGEYVIRAWSEIELSAGSRSAPALHLGIRGNSENAEKFETTQPDSGIKVRFDYNENDPFVIRGTIESPITIKGKVALILPPAPAGLKLVEGNDTWIGEIQANQPLTLNYRLALYDDAPRDDAEYVATISFYPDPSIDGMLHYDELKYHIVNGAVVSVTRKPEPLIEEQGNYTPTILVYRPAA